MHYDGRNRAWGGFSPQGAQPSGGSLSLVVGDKPRTWLAQYGAGRHAAARPSIRNGSRTPQQVIPERQAPGSLDPLSAAISRRRGRRRGVRPHGAVERRQAAHRHHPEEDRHRARRRPPACRRRKGDLLVCDIYTKRVAGEFDDAPKEAETERERPMRDLARAPRRHAVPLSRSSSRRRPASARSAADPALFRERPLTPEESQAMRR